MLILAINPGGGSTKVGVYRNLRPVFEVTVRHPAAELRRFCSVLDQLELRKAAVMDAFCGRQFDPNRLDAIVARGGTLKPLTGGIYRITDKVVADIRAGRVQTMHASLLGPLIAKQLADMVKVPAYFVDPESMDEFWPVARVTGLPEIPRRALSHALSVKSVAKLAAQKLGRRYERCNFVVAHLGTGITIAAHLKGRQVDASNANEDGPLAPQRSGALPIEGLVNLCLADGRARKTPGNRRGAILDRLQRQGGLLAHLGTDDIREVERRIGAGDRKARLIYDAMVYQMAKEVGAYCAVLRGRADAIVLTGGMTLSRRLVRNLRSWIRHLAPRIIVYPGEEEMKALVSAVVRLDSGIEKEQVYE
jgi:butyrate kinase